MQKCQHLVSLKARKGPATHLSHLNCTHSKTASGVQMSPGSGWGDASDYEALGEYAAMQVCHGLGSVNTLPPNPKPDAS